jgi:hypothetical protein
MSQEANVAVAANVMLVVDPTTGRERSQKQQSSFIAGDLIAIQNAPWMPVIRSALTPTQLVEYDQYRPCFVCGRVAGLCSCRARMPI